MFTGHLGSLLAVGHTVANEETDFAQPVLLLHGLDDVSLLSVRGISEFGTHSDLVGKTN